MIRVLVLFLLLFCFGGCCTLSPSTETKRLKLLPPEQGPDGVLLKQTVKLDVHGEQYQFLTVIRLEKSRLRMVALLPTGQSLLSLEYDGDNLTQESFSSIDIPGEEILAILQFALWSEISVEKHYPHSEGWALELSFKQRRLLNLSEILLEVNYQENNTIIVENYLHRGFRIIIHTYEREQL